MITYDKCAKAVTSQSISKVAGLERSSDGRQVGRTYHRDSRHTSTAPCMIRSKMYRDHSKVSKPEMPKPPAHTTRIDGIGFLSVTHTAVCSCGWTGPIRYNDFEAQTDADDHAFAVQDRACARSVPGYPANCPCDEYHKR